MSTPAGGVKLDELPSPDATFVRVVDTLQGLAGLDRRFAERADGVMPLRDIARALGVNVLRARHLADVLVRRGVVKVNTSTPK